MIRLTPGLALCLLLTAHCAPDDGELSSNLNTPGANDLNLAAGSMILYEVQVRSANACHPGVGSPEQRAACTAKVSPKVEYRAEGMTCSDAELQKIRLGTL